MSKAALKTNDPLVSIVIVNYNSGTCLMECIKSVSVSYTHLTLPTKRIV